MIVERLLVELDVDVAPPDVVARRVVLDDALLPISRMIQELGKDALPIPHFIAKPMLQKLWRLGLVSFPPGELPHLKYQCMVDGRHAKEVLGFRPNYSLRETIRSVLEPEKESSSF